MDKILEAQFQKMISKSDERSPDEESSERLIWKFCARHTEFE